MRDGTTAGAAANVRAELVERLGDPGYTPAVRDLDALVTLLAEDTHAIAAERAIARIGPRVLFALTSRFATSEAGLRPRLVRVVGRLASKGHGRDGVPFLLAALQDPDAKTRRNAAVALGHVRNAPDVELALLGAWAADTRPEMQRSLAQSLGKVGTSGCLPLLRQAATSDDMQLASIARRATLMVERTMSRSDAGGIDPNRPTSEPVELLLTTRRGLEDIATDELSDSPALQEVHASGPGRVSARLRGSPSALFASRTMLGLRFVVPNEAIREGERQADAIARAVCSDTARSIFASWTLGAVRYRIAWAVGGHRRAAVWDTAQAIADRAPELVNDPTRSIWQLHVSLENGTIGLEIEPRALADPRFTWRRVEVPAASHPTIAAALARIAGVRPDDVVWDPFVGSGAELVERGLLGAYRSMLGTDISTRALDAARANLGAAKVAARLEHADALATKPGGVTLIITNPPMGRRSQRSPRLGEMLDRFVAHASHVLIPSGRLVWMAPRPERARLVGKQAGLQLESSRLVDMGGFDAELQCWVKPTRPGASSPSALSLRESR